MAKMTAGRAVVESLVAQGVDTVFGIISIHTLHLLRRPPGGPRTRGASGSSALATSTRSDAWRTATLVSPGSRA